MAENSDIPSHSETSRATRKDATAAGPWNSLASRSLTAEDEREIEENTRGFFSIVAQWDAEEKGPRGIEQFRGTPRLGGAA